jgi:hypothetical protein
MKDITDAERIKIMEERLAELKELDGRMRIHKNERDSYQEMVEEGQEKIDNLESSIWDLFSGGDFDEKAIQRSIDDRAW